MREQTKEKSNESLPHKRGKRYEREVVSSGNQPKKKNELAWEQLVSVLVENAGEE